MYWLYSIILALGLVLSSPYWLVKGILERKYLHNFLQRFSLLLPTPIDSGKPLWIHAVSVGEILAAKSLLSAIRAIQPEIPVIVSTVTLTGMALARKELSDTKSIFYFPFDWGFCVNRFLNLFRPRAVVLMETELWPNFLNECSRRSIAVFLANGRISDSSWNRYRRVRWITKSMLLKIHTICAQTERDQERLLELGAREDKIHVTGNLKFDFPAATLENQCELLESIKSALRLELPHPVIVVGSSMKGEESLLLDAFVRVREAVPGTRLIIAPRHPERFDEVAQLISEFRLSGVRRTEPDSSVDAASVFLLDTIGELRTAYSLATVVVIGGTFQNSGGHNPLEPAALGKAIVFGPDMSNFREIAGIFMRQQAATQCPREALPEVLIDLLRNDEARDRLGRQALATLKANRGAAVKSAQLLLEHIA